MDPVSAGKANGRRNPDTTRTHTRSAGRPGAMSPARMQPSSQWLSLPSLDTKLPIVITITRGILTAVPYSQSSFWTSRGVPWPLSPCGRAVIDDLDIMRLPQCVRCLCVVPLRKAVTVLDGEFMVRISYILHTRSCKRLGSYPIFLRYDESIRLLLGWVHRFSQGN
jgi:hypothetical protein